MSWAGGWGLTFAAGGKAQASVSSSQKIAQLVQATGEYSFETWVNPNNVAQTEAYIMTYSGSDKTRNATLAQSAQSYEGRTRSSTTDTNGSPPLINATAENVAQAALQHVVLTYDPVNGQQIYVNGALTPDKDPAGGGSLASWDSTFALTLGGEVTGKEQWLGTIKFAAIHSRALTAAQVLQNFNAGVGQSYFLLFDVSSLSGIPQTYIEMQASQYDTYSYLFTNPTFISLNPAAAPSGLVISGMRIGINGIIPTAGQSYATLSATVGPPGYTPTGGQVLSTVGDIVAVDQGPGHRHVLPVVRPVRLLLAPVRRADVYGHRPGTGYAATRYGDRDVREDLSHDVGNYRHARRAIHERGGDCRVSVRAAGDAFGAADQCLPALTPDRDLADGECLLHPTGRHLECVQYVLRRRRLRGAQLASHRNCELVFRDQRLAQPDQHRQRGDTAGERHLPTPQVSGGECSGISAGCRGHDDGAQCAAVTDPDS